MGKGQILNVLSIIQVIAFFKMSAPVLLMKTRIDSSSEMLVQLFIIRNSSPSAVLLRLSGISVFMRSEQLFGTAGIVTSTHGIAAYTAGIAAYKAGIAAYTAGIAA
jgi:hypothetical protein